MPVFRSSKLGASLNAIQQTGRSNRAQFAPGLLTSRTTGGVIRKPAWKASLRQSAFFPFRVYSANASNTEGEKDGWRKVVVRSGTVACGSIEVSGTDSAPYPYSKIIGEATNIITIPESQTNYPVWIKYLVGAGTAEIKHGTTDWTMYPSQHTTEGTICILVAAVTTSDDEKASLQIRQYVTSDLPDYLQACVSDGGTDRVVNVMTNGEIFDFA